MAASHPAPQSGPKTAFGKWMVYKVIPQYANNVQGLVYVGAAILIIIVGLRGLGSVAGTIPIVPSFIINEADNKINVNYVMFALFLEFFLLLVLSIVTFFTPEEDHSHGGAAASPAAPSNVGVDAAKLRQELSQLKAVADEDLRMLDSYVARMGELSKRLAGVNREYLNAVAELKASYKPDTFKNAAGEEIKTLDAYLDKVTGLTQRLAAIKKDFIATVSEIKKA